MRGCLNASGLGAVKCFGLPGSSSVTVRAGAGLRRKNIVPLILIGLNLCLCGCVPRPGVERIFGVLTQIGVTALTLAVCVQPGRRRASAWLTVMSAEVCYRQMLRLEENTVTTLAGQENIAADRTNIEYADAN